MKYSKLGRTDITVSELSFGASPFGNMYSNTLTQEIATTSLSYAVDHGINYIDVAPYYGHGLAEERLGKALSYCNQEVVISTKVGRYEETLFDFTTKKVQTSINESLKRLSRDYLDIVWCHDVEFADPDIFLDEAMDVLVKLKQEGVIRAIGVSGFPISILSRCIERYPLDLVLSYCQYTVLNQELLQLQSLAENYGVGIVNASPFSMGLLTVSGPPTWHPASDILKKRCDALLSELKKEIEIEHYIFYYALSCPCAATLLVGMSSVEDVKRCLDWVKSPINLEKLHTVRAAFDGLKRLHWTTV